ncbi:MAG: HEAT repeat domain-containing protein, partial [Phycisphaeraceae bacterium]|nr:HEAT repeat domain-containing protein [Phycisphaeraceae bacterium]
MNTKKTFVTLSAMFLLVIHAHVALAARPAKVACPDFTQGDKIPEGWTHDWTLGPTGMRGWIYCDTHTTTDSRQIKVTKVEKGSPADGVVQVGDVILGVHGKLFDHDARILFGKAITKAEKTENQGHLALTIWRNGNTTQVAIQLEVMGSYSPTAPFNCSKSNKILDKACAALANKMKANPTDGSLISRALNATLLLASGDPEYLPVVKEQAKLLSQYNQSSGVITWNYGFVNIFLGEYVLATGDRTYVDEGLKRITKMAVDGQGLVGSYGHKFADLKTKRLSGYGMMNSPGLLLTYSMVLAQRAGVDVPGLDKAIDKSTTFLKFYVGKGAIPYGDHNPWIETHDDNGKCGLATVLFDHQGNADATEFYSRMSVADHGVRRDEGHTGNYFNMTWALPGVVRSGPHASGAWLAEFGWYYDLARRWDGTFLYQGAPEPRPQVYDNWESTGSYLLGFTTPLKRTYLTGRKAFSAPQVSREIAAGLIEDGRGWTNKDRTSAYDKMTVGQLLERLSSWSPTVRERTAMALGRKREDITAQLTGLLETGDLYTRYGACQAIKMQRGRAATAVPALLKTFDSEDLWLRILCAEALAGIGAPAKAAVPEMLKRFVNTDPESDPRNMEQRYLAFAMFNKRGGLLGRSVEGVDRDLLIQAIRLGLTNEDGRARGSLASVYENLTFDELKPLLPDIYQAIKEQAPSDIMFSAEIRMAGLKLFAENGVSEGIELCVDYARNQRQHASEKRIDTIMAMLKMYGAHAKRVTDQLEAVADYFE